MIFHSRNNYNEFHIKPGAQVKQEHRQGKWRNAINNIQKVPKQTEISPQGTDFLEETRDSSTGMSFSKQEVYIYLGFI